MAKVITSEEYQRLAAKDMSEDELLENIIRLAHFYGWRVAHFRPAKTAHGWRTAVSADGAGFPDTVLAKGERVIFAELKSMKGKLTDEQIAWGAVLPGYHVWRPSDWFSGEIEKILQEG